MVKGIVVERKRSRACCGNHLPPECLATQNQLSASYFIRQHGRKDLGVQKDLKRTEYNLLAKEWHNSCRASVEKTACCSPSTTMMYNARYVLEEPFLKRASQFKFFKCTVVCPSHREGNRLEKECLGWHARPRQNRAYSNHGR